MENTSAKYRRRFIAAIIKPGILLSLGLFLLITNTSAQNNTLYLIPSVPQTIQLNPALKHKCKVYVSLPVISSLRLSVRNTGFGFHDVIHTGTGALSGNYYLDIDNLDNKLRRMNFALVNEDIDLLGFGFSIKEWYVTFGISNHLSVQGTYPHDIVSLRDGNWDVNTMTPLPVKLNKIGVNATAWNSIGVSASKEVSEGFRIGARLKYINGMANVSTRKTRIELNTTDNPITLSAEVNYKVNSSLPVTLGYAANGLVNSVDFSPAGKNLIGNYIFNGNRGAAIDGGIIYDLDEATQVSASFTDLGFIKWKKNVNNFTGTGTFVFRGIDLDQYVNNPGQGNLLDALVDSLKNAFRASSATNGYMSALPLNIYGGITRELMPNVKAGAMTWIEINGGHIRPSLTFSLNLTPFNAFAATVSYTVMNNKLNQIGGALVLGNRGAQFYLATDNIPVRFTKDVSSGLMWPYNARMMTVRLGMNLFFGCNEKDDKANKKRYPGSRAKDDCAAYW